MLQEQLEDFIHQPLVVFNHAARKGSPGIFCFPPALAYGIAYKTLAAALPEYCFHCFNFIANDNRVQEYITHITRLQPTGPIILLGFSAAGKLVFETAAAMEQQGLQVPGILLLDSFWPAEDIPPAPPDQTITEINTYLEELGVGFLKEKIFDRINDYWAYFSNRTPLERVKAAVHIVVSEERQDSPLRNCWEPYVAQAPEFHPGAGSHANMIYDGGIEKNAPVIRGILEKFRN